MTQREFTCIICPNGCTVCAQLAQDGSVQSVTGGACPRGEAYVRGELTDPRRNIASSVPVQGGELPLVSVRLTQPVPKARIFDVMRQINRCRLTAPVRIGQVVIADVLGLGADVIATKNVDRV